MTLDHVVRAARFQLIGWPAGLAWPWGIMGLSFGINLAVFAIVDSRGGDAGFTGGLASIYAVQLIAFIQVMTQFLPFAMGMSVTRRAYAAGVALYAVAQAAAFGAVLVVLLAIEKATGGWGVSLEFFGVPFLRQDDPMLQYAAYVVPFLVVAALGSFFGLVLRRWGGNGAFALSGAGVVVGGAVAVVLTWLDAWRDVGAWIADRSAAGLVAGYPLVLTVALAAASWLVIRRVTL